MQTDIPKLIHHIWVGNNVMPDAYKTCIVSWKKMHPVWKFILWDNASLTSENFIYLEKIKACKIPAQAADLMRYEILLKHGGIYLDCDILCLNPIDSLLGTSKGILVCNEDQHFNKYCTQAFIACSLNHPVLSKCVNNIPNIRINTTAVNMESGPFYFRRHFKDEEVELLPTNYFYPERVRKLQTANLDEYLKHKDSFGVHLWGGSWRGIKL